jgi:hypothetical protein
MSTRLFFSFSLEIFETEHGRRSIRVVAFGEPSGFPPNDTRPAITARCVSSREFEEAIDWLHEELEAIRRKGIQRFARGSRRRVCKTR